MTSIVPKKTPKSRADWHLSNLVLEGGKSKRPDGKYISRNEKGGWEAKTVSTPTPTPPESEGPK
jgi:hypothetical protein